MGIQVYFYNQFSKKRNSTLQPQENTGTLYTCVLKDNTSVTAPIIEIHLASSDPTSYTYAYIPVFNRYYYVKDWTWVLGVWTASLEVDVLASFKTDIGGLSRYVLRTSAITEKPEMPDNLYPVTNTWRNAVINFNTPINWEYRTYVIGILTDATPNTKGTLGSVKYYIIDEGNVKLLVNYLLSDDFYNTYVVDSNVGISLKAGKSFTDPLQYIVSLQVFPFAIPYPETSQPVKPKLGCWNTTTDSHIPAVRPVNDLVFVDPTVYTCAVPTNPNITVGKKFLKYEPYTHYSLTLEPFGIIPLDTDIVADLGTLYFGYAIDLVTGLCRVKIGSESGKADIGTYTAQLGVDVLLAQMSQDYLGATFGLGSSLLNVGTAIAMANPVGAFGGIFQGVANAVNSIKPEVRQQGANGSLVSFLDTYRTFIKMTYCDCVDTDISHFGYVCNSLMNINHTGNGYYKCAEGDNDINCTLTEKNEIDAFLLGGFFYE